MGSLSLIRDHSSFTRMIWISWSDGSSLKEGVSIDSVEGQADPELRLGEAGREALASAAFQSVEKRSVGSEARAVGEEKGNFMLPGSILNSTEDAPQCSDLSDISILTPH